MLDCTTNKFMKIERKMEKFLFEKAMSTVTFSHFGFVVKNIERSIQDLKNFNGKYLSEIKKNWVEAYMVYVIRIKLKGKELEYIEPAGESFFSTFLNKEGESLHHLAFQVNNIDSCLEVLNTNGVELIDKEPRSGSHGKIAFLMPELFGKLYIELFQKPH